MPKVSAFSPSRLAVYQRCARRYYWQYVVKVPRKPTGEQSVGISIHGVMEAVQQAGGLGVTGLAGALALLQDKWESAGFATPEDEAAAKQAAQAMLERYLQAQGEGPGVPVMLEKKLTGSYDDVPLLGIVDRVDRHPDGSLELIDYKSGRSAAAGAGDPEVVQQLAVYRHLVGQATGAPPTRVTVAHITAGSLPITLAPDEWDAQLKRAAAAAKAITAEENYDPRISAGCRTCDYAGRCQAYQRARREASAEAATAAGLI